MATTVDWERHRAGAHRDVSVYWVGHSLVEGKAEIDGQSPNLMTLVGKFAAERGLSYTAGDHTRYGSSLAALWRGAPHTYRHDAVAGMEKVREKFEAEAGRYNVLVATEALPVKPVRKVEYSDYYLRRFFCTLRKANPAARIYVYETWVHLNGSPSYYGSPEAFDWMQQMQEQSAVWDSIADEAASGKVVSPPWFWRIRLSNHSDAGCADKGPIFTVPVGRAFVAVARRLENPRPTDSFQLPSGRMLEVEDLYLNPYRRLAASDKPAAGVARKPRDESKPLDDIHMGATGLYLSALVHFATLYRQTPIGLSSIGLLGDKVSRTLQCIAWETVVGTSRAGVQGRVEC